MLSQQNTDALKLLEQCFDELDSNNLEVAQNKLQRAASFVDDEKIIKKLNELNDSQLCLKFLSFGAKKLPLSDEDINPLSLGVDNISYQNLKESIHSISIELYKKLKYTESIHSSFNLLKESVDEKLINLNPELLDKLESAFKAVSLNKQEQNSLALTSCRRLLESLSDKLFPAQEEKNRW